MRRWHTAVMLAVLWMLMGVSAVWADEPSQDDAEASSTADGDEVLVAQAGDGEEESGEEQPAAKPAKKGKKSRKPTQRDGEKSGDDIQSNVALAQASGLAVASEARAWQVNASSSVSVGLGSFVDNPFARQTRVSFGMGFGGSYNVKGVGLFSVRGGFTQWLTRGGDFFTQSPQQFRWGDMLFRYQRTLGRIPVVGIISIGSLDVTIPTSRASRNSDLITAIAPRFLFIKSFGPLTLIYFVRWRQNFHRFTSTTYDPTEVDIIPASDGSNVFGLDAVADGGVLPNFTLTNAVILNYSFLGSFLASVVFGFADTWTYNITPDDELTSEFADGGRGHRQISFGTISLTYNPVPNLSTTLSLDSAQPWKTADNSGFRFPFFDFESTANNFTTLSLSISGFY